MQKLTPKQLGDAGENHAVALLEKKGYKAEKLEEFLISVKVARDKQHVRMGSRRSVLRLKKSNFIFAFIPTEKGCEITELKPEQYRLLILPAEFAREDALSIHDPYWDSKSKDKNGFSVMVKGYGSHHKEMWPNWLEYTDAWHLLP